MENEKKDRASWEGHYIADPALFKAVTFANQMLSEGKSRDDAFGIAANYNKIMISAVALEFMVNDYMKRDN